MRFDERSVRIFRLVRFARLEHSAQRATLLLTILVRLRPVVDTGQTRNILHIRHETRADDVVFILKEQRHVTIVRTHLVPGHRAIENHVGRPGVLIRDISAGLCIPVLGSLRAHDNCAKQPIARVDHHVASIPDQRRRFTIERIRVVGVGPFGARHDRLIAWVVADVDAQRIFRIKGQSDGGEGSLARLHLVLQLHFDAIPNVHAERERHGLRTARQLRSIVFQGIDLGLGVADLDRPLEVHFDGGRRLRIELHRRIIQGHHFETLHRGVNRTNWQGLGDLALDGEPGRQFLQIGLLLIVDTDNAPATLGELRGAAVEVDVVTRLQPRSAGLWHYKVIALGNADVHRILPVGIACISLTQERMAGQGPGHRFVHQGMQQPKHHRITDIRPQERRVGITMNLAIEGLRHIRVGG
ncbi:MAG: hypothetical protein JW394_0642 [Nitrospira sp.]|nr:hypothetical protein [Nitrospira sp.]